MPLTKQNYNRFLQLSLNNIDLSNLVSSSQNDPDVKFASPFTKSSLISELKGYLGSGASIFNKGWNFNIDQGNALLVSAEEGTISTGYSIVSSVIDIGNTMFMPTIIQHGIQEIMTPINVSSFRVNGVEYQFNLGSYLTGFMSSENNGLIVTNNSNSVFNTKAYSKFMKSATPHADNMQRGNEVEMITRKIAKKEFMLIPFQTSEYHNVLQANQVFYNTIGIIDVIAHSLNNLALADIFKQKVDSYCRLFNNDKDPDGIKDLPYLLDIDPNLGLTTQQLITIYNAINSFVYEIAGTSMDDYGAFLIKKITTPNMFQTMSVNSNHEVTRLLSSKNIRTIDIDNVSNFGFTTKELDKLGLDTNKYSVLIPKQLLSGGMMDHIGLAYDRMQGNPRSFMMRSVAGLLPAKLTKMMNTLNSAMGLIINYDFTKFTGTFLAGNTSSGISGSVAGTDSSTTNNSANTAQSEDVTENEDSE